MPNSPNFVDIHAASFAYWGGGDVVLNVELSIPTGAVHCLVGRSGCGENDAAENGSWIAATDGGVSPNAWRGCA